MIYGIRRIWSSTYLDHKYAHQSVQAPTSGHQITTFALIQRFVVARAETTSHGNQRIIGYRVTLSIAYSTRNDGTQKPQHHLGS
ncbi:hypothetical protein T08_3377 [Trichinella sp. T8]|nr:hypothetical protein T08_3377 [Trichinella sp. T8]